MTNATGWLASHLVCMAFWIYVESLKVIALFDPFMIMSKRKWQILKQVLSKLRCHPEDIWLALLTARRGPRQ